MRTWIFDSEKLDTAIAEWVKRQIETGHPSAVKNAAFVGEAIKDMLNNESKLFKDTETVGEDIKYHKPQNTTPAGSASVKRPNTEEKSESGNFSIQQMLKDWENM